jgi:hypothetical protein
MDHLDAENMKAVERYALGDLSVSEVEEFERHFFDCPQCSEELRALTIFQENARAVFIEQDLAPIPASVHAPESAVSWLSRVSNRLSPLFSTSSLAMALAALAIGIFAGHFAFAARDSAQSIGEYPLYAQARGEETVVSPAAASKFYTLYFDKTWDGDYSSYKAVLRDAPGTDRLTIPMSPSETFHALIPSHGLPPGKYVLVVFGTRSDKETELARLPFNLQIK